VADDQAAQLQSLTSFGATVVQHPDRTVLDIVPAGASQPVARMTKVGALRKRAAYELLIGPQLTTPAGQLSASGALDAAGNALGIVNLSGGKKADADIHPLSGGHHTYASGNPTKWRVIQPRLPPLAVRGMDRRTRRRYNRAAELVDTIGLPNPYALGPQTFGFSGPGCAGFTVTLDSGKSRLDVTVHDQRVDRRLILACLAALTLSCMDNMRREVTEVLTYFRRSSPK
jgi:hypothetical protein